MHIEKAKSAAVASAGIGRNVAAVEQAHAEGVYHVECYGPREEFRDLYCQMRDYVADIKAQMKGGMLQSLALRAKLLFIHGFTAPSRVIASIERQMATMVEFKWADTAKNAVLAEGKNYVLDKAFAGSSFTAAWYVGIYNSGYSVTGSETYAAKGATENTNYSQGTRPAAAWNAASAGSKALSGTGATFSINGAGGTIAGMFLATNSTKGDSTASAGVNAMWSIGAFSGGNKTVASGDTLNVGYSTSL